MRALELHEPEGVDIDDDLGAGNFAGGGFGEHGAQERVHLFAAGRFQDEVVTIVALKAKDGRGGGAENANTFVASFFKPTSEFSGPGKRFV
jgi:hypothetical protein